MVCVIYIFNFALKKGLSLLPRPASDLWSSSCLCYRSSWVSRRGTRLTRPLCYCLTSAGAGLVVGEAPFAGCSPVAQSGWKRRAFC